MIPSHCLICFGYSRMSRTPVELSILIPAHNEESGLALLIPSVVEVLQSWPHAPSWELIIVDDGSTDGTADVVRRYRQGCPHISPQIRFVQLACQSGQSTALAHAVQLSAGYWLATLDGDGQNDPSDLPRLWQAAHEDLLQVDAVLGWRENRQDRWRTRWVSRIANRVRNAALGQQIRDTGCSTRLIRADYVRALPRFEGWHRFLGPMIAARGAVIRQIPVRHHARLSGRSHYHWRNRGLRVVIDLLGVAWINRRVIQTEGALSVRFPMERIRIDLGHGHQANSGGPNLNAVEVSRRHETSKEAKHERLD